jgi:hypothetical protein
MTKLIFARLNSRVQLLNPLLVFGPVFLAEGVDFNGAFGPTVSNMHRFLTRLLATHLFLHVINCRCHLLVALLIGVTH